MNIVEVWDVLHIQAPQLYRQVNNLYLNVYVEQLLIFIIAGIGCWEHLLVGSRGLCPFHRRKKVILVACWVVNHKNDFPAPLLKPPSPICGTNSHIVSKTNSEKRKKRAGI